MFTARFRSARNPSSKSEIIEKFRTCSEEVKINEKLIYFLIINKMQYDSYIFREWIKEGKYMKLFINKNFGNSGNSLSSAVLKARKDKDVAIVCVP